MNVDVIYTIPQLASPAQGSLLFSVRVQRGGYFHTCIAFHLNMHSEVRFTSVTLPVLTTVSEATQNLCPAGKSWQLLLNCLAEPNIFLSSPSGRHADSVNIVTVEREKLCRATQFGVPGYPAKSMNGLSAIFGKKALFGVHMLQRVQSCNWMLLYAKTMEDR